jgi:hypothetical protein
MPTHIAAKEYRRASESITGRLMPAARQELLPGNQRIIAPWRLWMELR